METVRETGKKRIPKKAVTLTLLALLMMAVGFTLALLQSETEKRANVFAGGDVDIILHEEEWDKEPDERVMRPGDLYVKDPLVENKSTSSPAYIFLEVHIPKADVRTVTGKNGEKDIVEGPALISLFTYTIQEPWILLDQDETNNNYNIYLYGYEEIVAPGDKTNHLFRDVTFANVMEGDIAEGTVLTMPLYAYAIQSEYLDVDTEDLDTSDILKAIWQEYKDQEG